MTRPAALHSVNIQHAPPSAAEAPPAPDAPKSVGISRGWRVALFLWATAFVCLLAYELLNTLVRSVSWWFR